MVAHRLKGSCLAFGARKMATLAHDLERSNDTNVLVAELELELEVVRSLVGATAIEAAGAASRAGG